jgi:hypothetical protein
MNLDETVPQSAVDAIEALVGGTAHTGRAFNKIQATQTSSSYYRRTKMGKSEA